MPDPGFIAGRRDQLAGLVITHAHEDHIGAVAWLWPQLRCPVYATPFAAAVLRRKLAEAGLTNQVQSARHPARRRVRPEAVRDCGSSACRTRSPKRRRWRSTRRWAPILHTGDWKLDPHPLVGPPSDEAALAELGAKRRAGDGLRFHQRDGRGPFRQRAWTSAACCRR